MAWIRHRKLSDPDREKPITITQRFTACFVEGVFWFIFIAFFPILSWKCVKKIKPNSVLVKHRLGHNPSVKHSGFDIVLPAIDRVVELRTDPQNIILPPERFYTRDRIVVECGLFVVYQIKDPIVCVRELQDIDQSLILASKAALPTVFSQNMTDMIRCSKKLVEYAICKNINNTVCPWGVEVVAAELTPFRFGALPGGNNESPVATVVNFIQKLAGHNPLPPIEKFTINEMIMSLKPYLTENVGEEVNAVVLMKLTGENGGHCLIDFKTLSMVANPTSCHPDVTITMAVDTLLSMIDNRETLLNIYKKGKMEIDGDMSVAWRLQKLF